MGLGIGVCGCPGLHAGVGGIQAALRQRQEDLSLATAFSTTKGHSMQLLSDVLVLLGDGAAVGGGVLYVYLADRRVSHR